MTGRLHLEALLFCILWVALAVVGWELLGWRAGAALSVGLFLLVMPASILVLSRTGSFQLERSVRWGILGISGLIVAVLA